MIRSNFKIGTELGTERLRSETPRYKPVGTADQERT